MITKENNVKVLSSFYVSDFHLEMIILPYMIKEIENNREIIILTEKKLEKSIKLLISRLNMEKDKKDVILKIDWNNGKIKNKQIKNCKDKTFFVIGTKKFIDKTNMELKLDNIKIVNCYDLEEVKENIDEIKVNSDMILNIKGEEML